MPKSRREIIELAALQAGEAVRKAIPTQGVIEKEGRANIVTAADLASEKYIMELILANFPTDAIMSEETVNELGNVLNLPHLWVIDPIDGTNNFRYQRNYSCISIAYLENGKHLLAAVYDPFRKELFFAEQGQGATLNGEAITVSDQTVLAKATVATDNSYDPAGTRRNLELALKIQPTPWIMMKGSAVLTMCEVAAGRLDLYFHTALKPWDNAAAFLILQEAGAIITNLAGETITFLSSEVIVSNPELQKQLVSIFSSTPA
jgi:myo-inositol-1(or 4)-monophosphatase